MAKNEITSLPFGTSLTDTQGNPIEPGTSAAIVAHLMETRQISRRAQLEDIDSLYQALHDYLLACMRSNVRVTNASMYAACGVTRGMINDWIRGRYRSSDPRYKEFALTLKSIAAQYREQSGAEGLTNPVLTIWWQKNYDGFSDDPVAEVAEDGETQRTASVEEIAEKYRHLLEDKSGERMIEESERRRKKDEAYYEAGDKEEG